MLGFSIPSFSDRPLMYVSGPISWMPEYNQKAFKEAGQKLEAMGYAPVQPNDFGSFSNEKMHWLACITDSIHILSRCQGLYLLAGWEHSTGAKIEHLVARRLNIPVYYEEKEYGNPLKPPERTP